MEEAWTGTGTALCAYGFPLTKLVSFKYLGSLLMATYEDWPAVVANLCKARNRWVKLIHILVCEGAYSRTPGTFFKSVVQAIILFGLETWVVNPPYRSDSGGFHHRVNHQLTVKKPWRQHYLLFH